MNVSGIMTSVDSTRECLSLQLSEVEMLASMYPQPGEFMIDDASALAEIQAFLDEELPYMAVQSRIGFAVRLDIEASSSRRVEVACQLAHDYPTTLPTVSLRVTDVTKMAHEHLTCAARHYVNTLERGELCIGSLLEWVKVNAPAYLADASESESLTDGEKCDGYKRDSFTRMWIYSHHLYSKIKRKDIIDFSAELQLTGFSMPGKPGMIVIEGYSDQVEEFWRRIRSMTWKQIQMKEKEDFAIDSGQTADDYRRFPTFAERNFDGRMGKGRAIHMDLGLLYQFLVQHGCDKIYPLYFGVHGRLDEGEKQ